MALAESVPLVDSELMEALYAFPPDIPEELKLAPGYIRPDQVLPDDIRLRLADNGTTHYFDDIDGVYVSHPEAHIDVAGIWVDTKTMFLAMQNEDDKASRDLARGLHRWIQSTLRSDPAYQYSYTGKKLVNDELVRYLTFFWNVKTETRESQVDAIISRGKAASAKVAEEPLEVKVVEVEKAVSTETIEPVKKHRRHILSRGKHRAKRLKGPQQSSEGGGDDTIYLLKDQEAVEPVAELISVSEPQPAEQVDAEGEVTTLDNRRFSRRRMGGIAASIAILAAGVALTSKYGHNLTPESIEQAISYLPHPQRAHQIHEMTQGIRRHNLKALGSVAVMPPFNPSTGQGTLTSLVIDHLHQDGFGSLSSDQIRTAVSDVASYNKLGSQNNVSAGQIIHFPRLAILKSWLLG